MTKRKSKKYESEYFSSVDDYTSFAFAHGVFGSDAVALKKKMTIPEPKLKLKEINNGN